MAITFKSVLASGGRGAVITVTYSSEFYNQTLTATNGTDTVTALATSAGTVDITVPSAGSWVVSCTISGETYTSETVSVDLSYSTELVAIPDGSTVTPTDDVQTWLKCAGIKDKNYTTLSEVLADSVTFNALLGDSNACAYMARCEGWAGFVPTMTSNTTPSGEAFGETKFSDTYDYYKAFDGSLSISTSPWSSPNGGTLPTSCGYKFTSPKVVKRVAIYQRPENNYGQNADVVLQGSLDGITFTDIQTLGLLASKLAEYQYFDITNDTAYLAYRVKFTSYNITADNGYCQIKEMQFYSADVTLTDNQYAMSMIGQYDVCCDALLGNATWASAIASSTYWDYVLQSIVPTMVSNTTPSGTCIADTENPSYRAFQAFDGNNSTMWLSLATGTPLSNLYIGYLFDAPTIVTKYYVLFEQAVSCTHKLQGYDGTNWVDLGSTSTVLNGYVNVGNATAYEGYRIFIVSQTLPSAAYAGGRVQTVRFYGRASSGEYIHGTYNESAYYLDGATEVAIVDPSTLSAGTYTFGSAVAKNPSNVSADYTKQIRVTKNTKEIVLRPDCALYWWGYEVSDLEDMTSSNGWSYTGLTASTPSRTTHYIGLSSGSSTFCGIGMKNSAYIGTIKAIVDGKTPSGGVYCAIGATSSKANFSGSNNVTTAGMSLASREVNDTKYGFTNTAVGRGSYLYALWYE